jgi:hypothetical protein
MLVMFSLPSDKDCKGTGGTRITVYAHVLCFQADDVEFESSLFLLDFFFLVNLFNIKHFVILPLLLLVLVL